MSQSSQIKGEVAHFTAGVVTERAIDTPLVSTVNAKVSWDEMRQRKALRIFRHLAHDIQLTNPTIKTPPSWLLRHLTRSHLCGDVNQNWRNAIRRTLTYIKQCTNPNNRHKHLFLDFETDQPLFPNAADFGLDDLFLFAELCLKQLERQSRGTTTVQ